MIRMPKTLSIRWITLTLGALATLVILAFSLPEPTTFAPSQVLIIGDSITELPKIGGNHGNKGWWQYLLDGKKGMFKFSAESGSGYIAKGGRGTTFYDRLSDISKVKPKAIIIAGGVNDRNASNPGSQIAKYYDQLAKILKSNRISPKNVYVIVPHPKGVKPAIAQMVKMNATRIDVIYVDVDAYSSTYDGIHPDTKGALTIEKNFTAKSNFDDRLK
jgi:lysophospholipase L1-like esterase